MDYNKLFKGLILDVESIQGLGASIKHGAIGLVAIAFILVILTGSEKFSFYAWLQNFLVVFIGLLIISVLVYLFAKLLKTKISLEKFILNVNCMFAASLFLVSMPLLLIVIFVLNQKTLGTVLFSLVPYYNFVVYGIAAESVSELKGVKAVLVALFSMSLVFIFYFILAFITI